MAKSTVVIVYESTGHWAAELRGALPPGIPLAETRSVVETYNALTTSPAALVAMELTADNIETIVGALLHLSRSFPDSVPIVLTQRTHSAWEDIIRQAGAVHFVDSPRRVDEIGQIARRWLESCRRLGNAANILPPSFEEEVAAMTPWQ